MSDSLGKDRTTPGALTLLAAGALAGVMSDVIVHPIDTIRTRLQVQRGTNKAALAYRGTWDAFRKIIRNEGSASLYKGFGAVLLGTAPAHALYFYAYELSKRLLHRAQGSERESPYVHLTAGLAAEVAGALVWTPMDVVKQRLQIQARIATAQTTTTLPYQNSWQAARTIVQEEGMRGLLKGYWAGVAVYGPFVSIYFASYEQGKHLLARWQGVKSPEDIPFYQFLFAGGVAGGLAAMVTTPLDVIKTRIQVQGSRYAGIKYAGWSDAIRTMLREEGVGVFAKGMGARITWIAPGCAITICAYELLKKLAVRFASIHSNRTVPPLKT